MTTDSLSEFALYAVMGQISWKSNQLELQFASAMPKMQID